MVKIGIIGGSGLEDPNILKVSKETRLDTPYGNHSSLITEGKINNTKVAVLARHGEHHSISPSNVNYRANIWALKAIGCSHIIASTAVGSLRKEIEPGHLIFPNQFIDFTKNRDSTFFDQGEVFHTPMADPYCPKLNSILANSAEDIGLKYHTNKTVITIEGPRFSTRSESFMFRSWNADIVNMSSCPEAALAREKNIHYASIAMATDYDCWNNDEETVTWEMIEKTMKSNASNVIEMLTNIITNLPDWNDICVKQ